MSCMWHLPVPLGFGRNAVYKIVNFVFNMALCSAKNRICNIFDFETTDSPITPQKFFNLKSKHNGWKRSRRKKAHICRASSQVNQIGAILMMMLMTPNNGGYLWRLNSQKWMYLDGISVTSPKISMKLLSQSFFFSRSNLSNVSNICNEKCERFRGDGGVHHSFMEMYICLCIRMSIGRRFLRRTGNFETHVPIFRHLDAPQAIQTDMMQLRVIDKRRIDVRIGDITLGSVALVKTRWIFHNHWNDGTMKCNGHSSYQHRDTNTNKPDVGLGINS